LEECEAKYKNPETNFNVVVDCLVQHSQTLKLFGEIMYQMDQLEVLLDRVQSEIHRDSIFKDIDDVYHFRGTAANEDCPRKRHIVQAIRRKLEWFNLFNGRQDTLFNWPWNPVNLYPPDNTNQPKQHLQAIQFSDKTESPLKTMRCLLAGAIRNTSNHLS
ncbi:hypothetical protein KR018_011861, partial [Drosophila ironensis]